MRTKGAGVRRERGVTLVEVAAATLAFAIIGGAMASSMSGGLSLFRTMTTRAEADRTAMRGLQRIADAVQFAPMQTLPAELLSPGGHDKIAWIEKRSPTEWGDETVIEWLPDPRDPTDGVDNNGNGVVDEGVVVRRLHPDTPEERRDVLLRGVARYLEGEVPNGLDDNGNGLIDEPGICFFLTGRALTIRVTLVRPDGNGGTTLRTLTTCVAIRN